MQSTFTVDISDPKQFDKMKVMIYGPPKHGKTFMAATASDHWTDDPTKQKGLILEDMLWLLFDSGGLDGLKEKGIAVPVINMEHATGKELMLASDELAKIARQRIKEVPNLKVVLDTVSTYNDLLDSHFETVSSDSRQKYGSIFNHNKRMFTNLKSLPCEVIFLAHTKELMTMEADGMSALQKRQKLEGLPGQFNVVPNIIGKAKKFYVNNTSMTLPLLCKMEKNKPTVRKVYPYGYMGMEGGTRFQNLGQEEPADMRIIRNKIIGGK